MIAARHYGGWFLIFTIIVMASSAMTILPGRHMSATYNTDTEDLRKEELDDCAYLDPRYLHVLGFVNANARRDQYVDYLLCHLKSAEAEDSAKGAAGINLAQYSGIAEKLSPLSDYEDSMLGGTTRSKRKLSVDMDVQLAADHFRHLQHQRKNLQKEIGALEHLLHVGRRRK